MSLIPDYIKDSEQHNCCEEDLTGKVCKTLYHTERDASTCPHGTLAKRDELARVTARKAQLESELGE